MDELTRPLRKTLERPVFRPGDEGLFRRQVHWVCAVLGLAAYVAFGLPGLLLHLAAVLALHLRANTPSARNLMDVELARYDARGEQEWQRFDEALGRKRMAVPGPRPHRRFGTIAVLASLVGAVALPSAVGPAAALARLAYAAVSATVLFGILFGPKARTRLVIGSDGIRVDETFVPYPTLATVRRGGRNVVLERISGEPLVVPTAATEHANRLASLLSSARDRALAGEPDPSAAIAAAFRDNARVDWRVRVAEAPEEERRVLLARVSDEELDELICDTADPELAEAAIAEVRRR